MPKILEFLNREQREAVKFNGKYLKINAGPGTGKTTTLAAKMLYIQTEMAVEIDEILGVSFSRSAKSQLLEKIDYFSDQIGYGGKPLILTFHSLAYRIIKYGIELNESRFRNGFQIINTEEFIGLNPSLLNRLCIQYSDREAINIALSQAYNQIRTGGLLEAPINHYNDITMHEDYQVTTYNYGRIIIPSIDLRTYWNRVNNVEKMKNVTDYQGLITEAIRLLKLKGKTYKRISTMYKYLFIDEYQDTSNAQKDLLMALIDKNHFLTIVGDKNQTIYTFNGSNSENMNSFTDHFRLIDKNNYQEINLVQNYRSTNEIINLANDFIAEENITPYVSREGFLPTIIETQTIKLAAAYIVQKIKELIENGQYKASEICILYRKNSQYSPQGKLVFDALTANGIPYQEFKSQTKENDNILAQISVVENEYEGESLDEVLFKLINKDANEELIEFIQDSIKQGAAVVEDLIDIAVEQEIYISAEPEGDAVTCQTVHNSKGLEFSVVFILYLGDTEFPHSSEPDIEEEKRLFYVGITRAQERLFILGKKGVHQTSFLDKCLNSRVQYKEFRSLKKEKVTEGFSEKEKSIIDKTTEQFQEAETREKEELMNLMDLFE